MPLQGLQEFQYFDLEEFLREKRLFFLKSIPWKSKEGQELGSRVILQILEDKTTYQKPETNNYGEQLTIKVRDVAPSAFSKLKPLTTEVLVADVERASIYGDFRNQLSIKASVSVKGA